MKKKVLGLLVFAMMVLTLTGCGKEETKDLTCKATMEQSGLTIEMKVKGTFGEKSNELKSYEMEYLYDCEKLVEEAGVELTDELASTMKDSLKQAMESELKKEEGLSLGEIKSEGNKFYGTIVGDVDTLKKEHPTEFKNDGEFTYDGFKKEYEDQGLTCE